MKLSHVDYCAECRKPLPLFTNLQYCPVCNTTLCSDACGGKHAERAHSAFRIELLK